MKTPASLEISWTHRDYALLAGAISVGLLNEFALTNQPAFIWMIIDYGTRFAALGCLFASPACRASIGQCLQSTRPIWLCVAVCAVVTFLAHMVANWTTYLIPLDFLYQPIASHPVPVNPTLKWIDLTFGLALVAISEELIFRGSVFGALKDKLNLPMAVAITSAMFGLTHWGGGIANMVLALIIGISFQISLRFQGSIIYVIISHYLINLVVFYSIYFYR